MDVATGRKARGSERTTCCQLTLLNDVTSNDFLPLTSNRIQQPILSTITRSRSNNRRFRERFPDFNLSFVFRSIECGSGIGSGVEMREVDESRDTDLSGDGGDGVGATERKKGRNG